MSNEELDEEELDKEMEKQWKNMQREKDYCGKPLPESRETGIQRDNVKVIKEKKE
ncbi:MAG: hypothetical protein ACOC4M_05895 [Promethearchaeia archaeon]